MKFNRTHFELLNKAIVGRAIFEPPFKISSALHDEARFVHVINGRSHMRAPKDRFDLSSGDSFIMKCENFVNSWHKNEDGQMNEIIVMHFYPEVLHFIYDNQMPDLFSKKSKTKPDPIEKVPPNKMVENYIESLRFYFDNPALMTDDLLKVKIKELILILANSDRSGRVKTILSELFQSTEYEFKEIVHANLYEDLNIEDIAFFAGLSLSSFKRKFKSVYGTSPGVYIKSKRLEKAKNLLEKTKKRITEIAFDCGFNDVGYFSKSFASSYNFSPSDYRKNYLSQYS